MNAASRILISFKAGQKVATYSVRKQVKGGKKHIVQTKILTPRGALTEESVYGKIKIIEKEKPLKYIFENPDLIIKNYIKNLVKERLALYNNDSKLALSSLKNQPIFIDPENQVELKYASCYKDAYVLKYPISTIKPKDTEYIVDLKVKELVQKRLEQFNNNPKEAFKEPLYFDSKKKNQIKTIRLLTNLSEVEPLKKNENGEPIAFVKPGNNHHIALYYDENNKLVEHICTFWHAVQRKKFGIPVIIKNPKEIWDLILKEKFDLPDNFLEKLPPVNLTFSTSMQQYEMFILGMDDDSFEIAYNEKDYSILSQYLYRVQNLSSLDYTFRHHLETNLDNSLDAKNMKKFYRIRSFNSFQKLNPKKVKISLLGELRLVEND
jgi:CRISPR-associated endonuclease Csn1